MSAVKGSLEKTGRYLDSLLMEMVTSLKLYVQDTRVVLSRISDLIIDEEVWLVGIDVESLYTSIPHVGDTSCRGVP